MLTFTSMVARLLGPFCAMDHMQSKEQPLNAEVGVWIRSPSRKMAFLSRHSLNCQDQLWKLHCLPLTASPLLPLPSALLPLPAQPLLEPCGGDQEAEMPGAGSKESQVWGTSRQRC